MKVISAVIIIIFTAIRMSVATLLSFQQVEVTDPVTSRTIRYDTTRYNTIRCNVPLNLSENNDCLHKEESGELQQTQ
jgi:hypothetical protein